ncbi:TPA: hypothetical protein ACXJQO_001371 [Serratia marcescens]|jgi:hypothetical protein|uniref:Uncharacterized protein n=1 Tax=Serratia marcescens TaxID=615 RepID=A0AB35YYT5_SERMA|nr:MULTISPECIES: hypothetical protein [Serratia]WIF07972.1 hypothetical protein QEP77_06975 [Serratia sp. B1]MBH1925512.1 hypothetical protein [Serratia ureilytica]MBH2538988.1 hypothetical protein [Serratia ureilytica]MBH2553298.1 hypothetical protein [Serratia ureilytica]MBH2650100.1 hypothetical protein [Serratia ureilytica]
MKYSHYAQQAENLATSLPLPIRERRWFIAVEISGSGKCSLPVQEEYCRDRALFSGRRLSLYQNSAEV